MENRFSDVSVNFDTFRSRLRELIENSKITTGEIAIDCAMAPATLSRYLTGKREPELKFVIRLAKRFGISMDWLLGLSDDKQAIYTKDVTDIADRYLHASRDDKQLIDLILSKYGV